MTGALRSVATRVIPGTPIPGRCAVLILASALATDAAGAPADSEDVYCADAATEVTANLNELKSKGGGIAPGVEFVEVKILVDGVDIGGWSVCFSSNPSTESCTDLGVGDGVWYDGDPALAPDGTDDSGPYGNTVYDFPTWIVFGATNLKSDEGEVILFNGDGLVVDYIRYSNNNICSDDQKRWDVYPNTTDGHSCGACVDSRDPSQKDFARVYPDGTGNWDNNGDSPTDGASNETPGEVASAFQINHDGSASTCVREPITLTVLNSGGLPFAYSGTVNLTTSTGHGNWYDDDGTGFSADPAAGALADSPGDDNGSASYTFGPLDLGTVTLYLENTHADDLEITVADPSGTPSTTSAILAFRDNAFVLSPLTCTGSSCPTPGHEVVAGRDHQFQLDMVRRDPTTGDCGNATTYTGIRNLKAWLARDAIDPGAAGPTIGGSPALGDAPPAASNISLTFTAGTAVLTLATTDVGKYILRVRDDNRDFATGVDIDGATSTLTVRPFGFAFSDINDLGAPTPVANPGVNTPSGAIFTSAGSDFAITLAAYLWAAVDDSDDNGIPDTGSNLTDNGLTAAYGWDTTISGAAPFTPATGVLGAISGSFIDQTDFGGGSFTTAIAYSEVGSVTLRAAATSFLNSPGVEIAGDTTLDGTSGVVGRFVPFDFAVTLDTLPEFAPACSSDTQPFTYMGQPFNYATAPEVTITARNAAGATTQNYAGTWWRLADFTESYSHVVGDPLSGGVVLDSSVAGHAALSCASCAGSLTTLFTGPFTYARGATPIAPIAGEVAISFTIVDQDGVSYAANPFTVAGIGFSGGNSEQRWGRLVVGEEAGSPTLILNVPLTTDYYDGTTFLRNVDDDCTSLTLANGINLTSLLDGSVAGDQQVILGSGFTLVSSGDPALVDGSHMFTFDPPGDGNTGYVLIEADLTTAVMGWLLSDWDGDGSYDNHPVGRASFGIISRPKELIYTREPWN